MGKEFNFEFGKRLAALRAERNYTREQLAEKAGLTEHFIYDMESGRKGCSSENLLKVSQALNTTADYLLTGIDREKSKKELNNIMRTISTLRSDDLPHLAKIIFDFVEFANLKK